MPTTSMIDLPPDQYVANGPRYHWDDLCRTITWPCPRCAATLTSTGIRGAEHDCALPKASPDAPGGLARVAAWWAGWDAAQEAAEPCRENHVPADAYVTAPTFTGLLALTAGDPHGYVVAMPDNGPNPAHYGDMTPVQRAILSARLRAWSDHFATPAETGADQ